MDDLQHSSDIEIDIKTENDNSMEIERGEIRIPPANNLMPSPKERHCDMVEDARVSPVNMNSPARDQENIEQPVRFTNFFVEEILKPEFGRRRRVDSDTGSSSGSEGHSPRGEEKKVLWPAWVYCTRYSDRPSSGPRSRKLRKKEKSPEEKRPRTAFTNEQLGRLRKEFEQSRYLTEPKRQELSKDLQLTESQIKIWFQNKRAKLKKSNGARNGLALQLMAQGLYNHATANDK